MSQWSWSCAGLTGLVSSQPYLPDNTGCSVLMMSAEWWAGWCCAHSAVSMRLCSSPQGCCIPIPSLLHCWHTMEIMLDCGQQRVQQSHSMRLKPCIQGLQAYSGDIVCQILDGAALVLPSLHAHELCTGSHTVHCHAIHVFRLLWCTSCNGGLSLSCTTHQLGSI